MAVLTAEALLASLTARGVALTPTGDRLHVRAPAGILTSEEHEQIAALKAERLGLLHFTAVAPRIECADDLDQLTVGAHAPCSWCSVGTWTYLLAQPLCQRCANRRQASLVVRHRRACVRAWHLMDLGAGVTQR